MEKVLRRLVISPRPFTDKQKADRDRLADFISIPGVLRVETEYRHVPDILTRVTLETNSGGVDLDEDSLKAAVAEPGYHNIHLTLTLTEWKKLGIRTSLYGQSQEIGGQGITYGHKGNHLKYYTPDIKAALTEETLVEWHELDHTLRALWGIDIPSTHYHFYGYAATYRDMPKKLQNEIKPRRWVRKPDPLEAWKALPWERLADLNTKPQDQVRQSLIEALLQLIPLLQLLIKSKQKLVKPLRAWGQNISQPYGEYNPTLYPLTKHHIGVDHAVPKGTPVYAPADGEAVQAGYTNSLGNYVVFKYRDNRYLVALHLEAAPAKTKYTAGQQLAVVGDTGYIKGVHSHLEVWTKEVQRNTLPADLGSTWRTITLDPLKEF